MGAPGFDDAPFWNETRASLPHAVTLVYPYYENPGFLAQQMCGWFEYPDYVRDYLRIIVVDDGSPKRSAHSVLETFDKPCQMRLFRIGVDVRWNWLAARNVGMHYAQDGWCVLTDMDHVVPAQTLDRLIYRGYDANVIYRFSRQEHTGVAIHPHPNSMFMTRAMFWRVGGYDEALSGCYGTDGDWRRRCVATAPVRTLREVLVRHEYQGDSSTSDYLRKQPEDARKKGIIAQRGKNWKPRVLSFPYSEVPL